MTKEELAYAAGIIDGEGCLRVTRHKDCNQFNTYVYVTNTDPRLINWLHNSWGGTINISQHKSTWKPSLSWRLIGKEAIQFIEAVYPFLRLKKAQADILLSLWELKKSFRIRSGRQSPNKYVERAGVLFEATAILNKRGIENGQGA